VCLSIHTSNCVQRKREDKSDKKKKGKKSKKSKKDKKSKKEKKEKKSKKESKGVTFGEDEVQVMQLLCDDVMM